MTGFSCFVVGEGVLVLSCLEVLSEQGCLIRAACSTDRTVQAWATENNVICTEDPAIFEQQILCSEYDYLFSINNIQWVISAAVIGRAGTATINYHDAPLPQQPRLQTTTWGASHLYAEVDRPHPKSLSLRERDFESGSLLPEGEAARSGRVSRPWKRDKTGLGMRANNLRPKTRMLSTTWAWLNSKTQHAITQHEIVLVSDATRIFKQKVTGTITGSSASIGDILPVLDRLLIPIISQQNAAICQQEQALAIARSTNNQTIPATELVPFEHPYLSTSRPKTSLQRYPIVLDEPIEPDSSIAIFAAYCARLSPESEFDLGLQIKLYDATTELFEVQIPLRIQTDAEDSFKQFRARLEAAPDRDPSTNITSQFIPVAIAILENPDHLSSEYLTAAMTFVAYADRSQPELVHTGALTQLDSAAIVRQLQNFIPAGSSQPEQLLAQLPLISTAEQQQLLIKWNQTTAPIPAGVCIHHLFEQQVARTPNDIAVAYKSKQLTYQELNTRANQ